MVKRFGVSLLFFVVVTAFYSCKDGFDKIRSSGNPKLMLNSAYDYFAKGEYQKAQYLFEDIIPIIKADTAAERVYYLYAYTHYNLKNYTFASYYFKQFASTYPNSKMAEEALFMSAKSYSQLSPIYRLDQSDTQKAIDGFQLFVNTFPGSKRVEECNHLIDEMRRKLETKAYESAYLYFKIRDYLSASYSFKSLLREYPDTENDEKIRFMVVKSTFKLAQNSIPAKQAERYDETIKSYYDFIDRYATGTYSSEAQSIFASATQQLKKLRHE